MSTKKFPVILMVDRKRLALARRAIEAIHREDAYEVDEEAAMVGLAMEAVFKGSFPEAAGKCQICGCTEEKPCLGDSFTGSTCAWANRQQTLCTSCVPKILFKYWGRARS